jgi:phage baseplate assembly protein W
MPQPVAAALPFAIDATGSVRIQPSATSQLRDRVTALASTQPGARVAAAGFGVDTARILFDWNDPMSGTQLAHELTQAMRVYEPGAVLRSVTPVMNPANTGVAAVLADATRADVAQGRAGGYATVFIDSGGDVTDYASTTPR